MMRFQRVSPDCLPLSNGRKSNVRTCKEEDDNGENGRIPNYNSTSSFEGKSVLRYRSRTTPSPSRDHNNFTTHFIFSESSPQSENHANTQPQKNQNRESSPSSSPSPSRGGDVLLQWGQNKRSRGSRAENRVMAMTDDQSAVQSRQVIKIQRRVEKQQQGIMKQTMPPPPQPSSCTTTTTSYSRSGNPRSSPSIRETTGSHLNRNLEDRSVPRNGSPSRSNGGGSSRIVARSSDKRSPDKTENKVGSCSVVTTTNMGEKQNGSSLMAQQADLMMSHVESTTPVASDVVNGEKVNLDMFEWPRIYISLSRKEKEDDFLAMKGTKLPQRPKKRAKNVDKTLQYCFPGMWLSDLTRGRYEVREKKCVKKQKRRGLKGMESMESDSE